MPRKITAAFLALVLAVSFYACGQQAPPPEEDLPQSSSLNASYRERSGPQKFTLAYYPKGGTNPYLANNLLLYQLQALLYQSIVTISPNWQVSMGVAQGVVVEDTTVQITVKSGLRFADGTPIEPQAVLASLQAAMKSEYYGPRFANVRKAELKEDTIIISLKEPDAFFAYLLDIPVLKAEDIGQEMPVSSGAYEFKTEHLAKNPYYSAQSSIPDEIALYPTTSLESALQAFKTGEISLFASEDTADLAGAYTPRVVRYDTNNLVFMGINASRTAQKAAHPLLFSAEGRQALGRSISREEIISQSYSGTGIAAAGPINPLYEVTKGKPLAPMKPEELEAVMQSLGYKKEEGANLFTGPKGEELTLRILCFGGNASKRTAAELITRQLADAGIGAQVIEAPTFEEYAQKVASGDFELYIGEVKLYNNMDLSLFFDGGTASACFARPKALLQSWKDFRQDPAAGNSFESEFMAEMPFVPILWRQATVFTAKNVQGILPSGSAVFYDISSLQVQAG